MNEQKHTPGPWRIAGVSTIRAGSNDWIGHVHWRNREANARLIAAAPDMLTVLRAASSALKSYQYGNSATELAAEVAAHCDAAIAKATGSQP